MIGLKNTKIGWNRS